MDLEFGVYTDYKGYEDYNEVLETSYDNDIITPRKVVVQMLDLLPDDVWNSRTTFLNIACKNGIFLQFILNRLMRELESEIPDANMRKQHILNNQLYGIATNEITALVSNRRIYDEVLKPTNIKYIGALDRYNIKNYENKVKKEFGEDMKFDVIIGNPPYQQATASIYQYFIDASIDLKPNHIIMVVKNNWMKSDTLKDTRQNMINNGLKRIINYPIQKELFEDVGVAVNILHIDKSNKGDLHFKEIVNNTIVSEYNRNIAGYQVILNNNIEYDILFKVLQDIKSDNLGQYTLPTEPFRVSSDFGVGRGINRYVINTNEHKTDEYNTKLIYMDGSRVGYRYVKKDEVPRRVEYVDKYKILCGSVLSRGATVVSNLRYVENGTICTGSWGVLYHSEYRDNVENAFTYIKTKLVRLLIRMLCDDGMISISPYRVMFVPLQDFTKPWTDAELYKKYNLTDDEIRYIEDTIKSID